MVGLIGTFVSVLATFALMRFVDTKYRMPLFVGGAVLSIAAWTLPLVFGFKPWVLLVLAIMYAMGGAIAGEPMWKVWSQELFPTMLRSTAQGISTAFTRVVAALVALWTPVVLESGPKVLYLFIVAQLLRLNRLGAFDFNSRFYADDDLIVGAADPFQLFRIMLEIVQGGALSPDSKVNFMLDQCHNVEEKIPGEILSVLNVQEATVKALLVDQEELLSAQRSGDPLAGNRVLMAAFFADVRPLLRELRETQGLDPEPYEAFQRSGYLEKIRKERVGGQQAGWGA